MSGTEFTYVSRPEQLPAVFAQSFAYWDECRGGNWAPAWSGFRLERLPPKLLPWSVVADVLEDDFCYRFWGSERARLIGLELSNKLVSQIPNALMRDANLEEYRQIRTVKVPMLFNTLITRTRGSVIRFQSLRLPISDDGVSVTKIFSALNYEQVNDLHFEVMAAMLRRAPASQRAPLS